LSATKASQAVSDSLDKGGKTDAFNRVSGESYILQPQYGRGQNVWQIKPNNLKFFEFLVLTKVMHDFAPIYSRLDRNCFWFGSMVINAIIKIFELDNSISPEDDARKAQYKPIDPYLSEISGCWMSLKVSETDPEDLAKIVLGFKKAHTDVIHKVKIFLF